MRALEELGAERVFCVPGESYLPVLDALHDASIPVTLCRQEGGAAMMAEAWGKMTGKPGICMVTRGPGATNAAAGVHVAQQDSTPMILFVGQIETGMRGRDAFQEVDYVQVFGSIAKWVAEIEDASRIPEMISRAYATATSGRPGPVVLALPEDVLAEVAEVVRLGTHQPLETHPSLAQMADLQKRLWAAKRPLAILGGSRWSEQARAAFTRFAERFQLPVGLFGSADRCCSTTCMITMPAMSGSASTPGWRNGFARRIFCCSSADACPKCRANPTRCWTFRTPDRPWCMSMPVPRSLAASIRPICR